MAGGGQKGLGLVGEAAVVAVIVFGIGYCQGRSGDSGGDGSDEEFKRFDTTCAQADTDKRSGEDEYNAVALADPECKEFLLWHEADEQMERQQELQEAQTP